MSDPSTANEFLDEEPTRPYPPETIQQRTAIAEAAWRSEIATSHRPTLDLKSPARGLPTGGAK